ncbi:hypothetical protein [Dendronalium sp. ChiSLP03b]|nr:hypothetical protein [Dendronalium sp. ChiSLP03b]MDZ8208909.1 hypothetical protein [Dendronalium sp. ChiSLP03b]
MPHLTTCQNLAQARRKRIVLAMSGGVVYTPDGEAVELQEMMRRFPVGE